ncbi:MAG TPA: NHL repeat-containing protein [Candidatus Eisenbacteria bacterium]|nr:NHL repeat-containing protein [Candidatus Eisenbacteria bacterium]
MTRRHHAAGRTLASVSIAALFGLSILPTPARGADVRPEVVLYGFDTDATFKVPRAVALDAARGEIVVGNTGAHTIEVFSLAGRPLARYIHRVERRDGGWVDGDPVGLAVDSAGRILVVDAAAGYVDVLDGLGRTYARLQPPLPPGGGGPGAVAVLKSGEILVGMSGETGRIHRFTREYALDGSWGEAGRTPGHLQNIRGVVEEPDGSILVLCPDTDLAVQRFSPAGAYLGGFGRHEIGDGNFSFPSGIALMADGRLYVTDELRHLVVILDSTGRQVDAIRGGDAGLGIFQYPSALASDGRSRLAVVERGTARLQLLQLAGKSPQ